MNNPNWAPEERQTNHRVMVIYENASGREHALRFCEELTAHCPEYADVEVEWLPSSQASSLLQRLEVVDQAAKADWVVFAVNQDGDFSNELKLWIELWLGKRCEREGTLVGLISGTCAPCDVACFKEVYLRHVAHRAGMDYLAHLPSLTQWADARSLETVAERANRVTAVLEQILHTDPQTAPLL